MNTLILYIMLIGPENISLIYLMILIGKKFKMGFNDAWNGWCRRMGKLHMAEDTLTQKVKISLQYLNGNVIC